MVKKFGSYELSQSAQMGCIFSDEKPSFKQGEILNIVGLSYDSL